MGSLRVKESRRMPNPISLTLAMAIALAQTHNPDLQATAASTVGAFDQVRAAQGDRWPTITAEDTFQTVDRVATLQTPIGPLPFQPNTTNVPLLALHYALYDGGYSAASVGRAAATLSAAQGAEYEARSALIARVTAAYADFAAAIDAARTLDAAVAVSKSDLDLTRMRFEQGVAPRADVLQAQAQFAERRSQADDAQGNQTIAHDRLTAAMGIAIDTPIVLVNPFRTGAASMSLQTAIDSALAARGELHSAKAALDAATAALEQARAVQRPAALLLVSEGNTQPVVVSEYLPQFTVQLQAVWKLFDGGATVARIAAASAAIAQAKSEYDSARIAVELEVREAYARMSSARERAAAAADAVTSSDESARIARLRYREGVGTQLELQQAELQLAESRLQLIQAQSDVAVQGARLRFAAGLL
jgi:outer membrane protein TolC